MYDTQWDICVTEHNCYDQVCVYARTYQGGQVCWYIMFKRVHRVEYAQQKRKPRKLLQTTKLVMHGDAVRPGVFVFMYMRTEVHQVCYG